MTIKEFGILILSIIAVLLFALNYPIAEYLAQWDVSPDVNLEVRFNIYALVIFISASLSQVRHNKYSRIIMAILISMCSDDVFDRMNKDYDFHLIEDVISIMIGFGITYWKEIKKFYHAYYAGNRY